MNRRNFLKSTAGIALAAHFPIFKIFGSGFPAPRESVVFEGDSSDSANAGKLFKALGGIEQFVSKEPRLATVLLKPNLCLPYPDEKAATTSSSFLESLCIALIEEGFGKIIIADHTLGKTADFLNTDVNGLSLKYPEVKVVFANEERMYETTAVNGKVLHETAVMKLISKADLFINCATAKHHTATQVSLAIKNLMGAIWDRAAFHTKMDLNQAIGDLAAHIRPHINIIDATRVLLTGGPTGPGNILKENKFFASRDIVALDAVVASRYNFGNKSSTAENIGHIKAAHHNDVGEIDLKKIAVEQI